MATTSIANTVPRGESPSLLYAGIAAPLLYAVIVIVGASLRTDYSHVRDAISFLLAPGSPNKLALDLAFVVYNLLFAAFGLGIARMASSRSIRVSGYLIVATGVIGVLMWGFPQDPAGTPATASATGTVHLILAGLMSLGTMAAVLSFAIGTRRLIGWRGVSQYSFLSFAFILITGGAGALAAAQGWSTMGLWERLTIGGTQLWVLVLAWILIATRARGTARD